MGRLILIFLLVLSSCQKTVKTSTQPIPVTAIRLEAQTLPADFEFVGV